MNASLALQQAVFTSLSADAALSALIGAGHVHDHVPHAAHFPYVTLGQSAVYDWGTASEQGGEHFVTLHAWSKARGRKEVLEIIEAVIDALEAAPPQPSGHVLVNLMAERIEVRFDDDLDGYHGLVRYRAVTEPAN